MFNMIAWCLQSIVHILATYTQLVSLAFTSLEHSASDLDFAMWAFTMIVHNTSVPCISIGNLFTPVHRILCA